ncbi:MAG: Na+/H+ antiporter NhaA [Alphaproteobacteria bacterium]
MSINIRDIIKSDAFSGLILICSLFAAILISNSTLYDYFLKFSYLPISLKIGSLKIDTSLITVVNHCLMSLFFLLIGLEMKYHLVIGQYKDKTKLILPVAAAIGGLILPAIIYTYYNYKDDTIKGWAIPIATDTAFVLGLLSFFGRRVSLELRIFILGLSLIDDAFAIIILTIFYTPAFDPSAFLISLIFIALLACLNYLKIKNLSLYLITGLIVWIFIEKSGIHGTLAGIILAFFIPVQAKEITISPLKDLEHALAPYVKYLILPIFAFINSAIPLKDIVLEDLFTNLSLGIVLGLFIGKQLGIFLSSFIIVKLEYAILPENTSWSKFYSIGILSGIGFTLSLFIGDISFTDQWSINTMRSAVILASCLSAFIGIIFLKFSKD